MIAFPGLDVSKAIEENDVTSIGGGLKRLIDGRILATSLGPLYLQENRAWVSQNKVRNLPMEGDFVIGIIVDVLGENYLVNIDGPRNASLDLLAFDGASRRNCPSLVKGNIVFARVLRAAPDVEPQITCEALGTGKKKDWTTGESQFGELKGGCLFKVKTSTCRRLCEGNHNVLLQALGKSLPFEICVGLNGKVWVSAEDPAHVILIGEAIRLSQGRDLGKQEADSLVKRLLANLKASNPA